MPEPEKPNFGSSGLLAKETNTVKGVELKYNEPPEARKPLKNWRLYVFKGTEQLGESGGLVLPPISKLADVTSRSYLGETISVLRRYPG